MISKFCLESTYILLCFTSLCACIIGYVCDDGNSFAFNRLIIQYHNSKVFSACAYG